LDPELSNNEEQISKKQFGRAFWRFHLAFWGVAAFIMFLSGLSQDKSFEVALVRNVLYSSLGLLLTLICIPLFDKKQFQKTLTMLTLCLATSYTIGTVVTLLVNPISAAQNGFLLWESSWTRWFSGSLNFSLVTLVWCSFYLAFKHGFQFVKGDDAQKAAQAISSISSVSTYPEFMALERNKKIFLLPVESISVVQGAGDYLEISTDEGNFLKRESLSNMVDVLDPKIFQRVHRSSIVNLNMIKEFQPKGKGDYTLILKTGLQISASRSYMKDFKSRFFTGV
jgi:hypothetical protein